MRFSKFFSNEDLEKFFVLYSGFLKTEMEFCFLILRKTNVDHNPILSQRKTQDETKKFLGKIFQ